MRFDLRAPGATAAQRADLHRTVLDMASWADEQGGLGSIVLSEHHSSDDGYLPSPITMAAAVAAVTEHCPITVAAAIAPFYDPVRLAEDIITLDHLSRGRAMVVLGVGYRREEYELFGLDFDRRGAIADRQLERLLDLLRDARIGTDHPRVTPTPYSSPMPLLAWGGRSKAAARRAGRHGIGFFAQNDAPGLKETYKSAAVEHGHKPGLCVLPPIDTPLIVFVADDVDAGWAEVGPSMLVDASAYAEWNDAAGTTHDTASVSGATTVDQLRTANASHRVVTPGEARDLIARHGLLGLHPLCGGLDPAIAWTYLRRAVAAVQP